ncbi:delta-1-pyrroline-5-carboxylate dehydrogenase, mitochondrial [Pectinophora gossypiella]|uniref:delta-1-pyrroline-5-carboxylate dehydrogenase, mitochondrial n=1 Tax=Pectinophora gossypiella TaxID=13191 RepID=UPI00214ED09F|nr:delta-1-pyrroline-5-carboxylate dehydrogenase, mitochondrial [Pectinophora gossypiella]
MLARAVCLRAAAAGPGRRSTCSVVQPPQLQDFCVANEPILGYRAGSRERHELQCELDRISQITEEVPIVVGGEQIREGEPRFQVAPHKHGLKIAQFYYASEKTIQKAIDVSVAAQVAWDRTPLEERVRIWTCAAELMATSYRQSLNAATMLGQSKTAIQAEIDAACELIDFFRFNIYFLKENAKYQPISEDPCTTLNSLRFRGIDGFIAAISPFNFTAIGGNLAYTPALMGNCVLWKPSDTALLSNWRIFNIMREAGLPDGIVNFVPADGPTFGKAITKSKYLSGINFTGSVPTFNWLWKEVGNNIDKYRNYPRLIGECGGKNYHFVHPSADVDMVVACTIRSAFEYCGQKCSACSRMYVPKSLHAAIVQGLLRERARLKVGNPRDFSTFMGAVIDAKAYARITGYIKNAKKNPKNKILGGGEYDDSEGYFVQPTIIETTDVHDKLMVEEIFGPVLTIYTYEDQFLFQTLAHVGSSTQFALTGAVFAQDECFLATALEELRMTAGNFYINDKSTGSVVGQQPFGGGRMSGTNDKAGGPNYVMRWTSPQSIKETFKPQLAIDYPYMRET